MDFEINMEMWGNVFGRRAWKPIWLKMQHYLKFVE